ATLLSNVDEHAMPARAFFGVVRLAICATTLDKSEFAIGDKYAVRWPVRQKSAARTRLAAETKRAALAAFEQRRRTTLKPCVMRWGLSTLVGIERPFDMVFRQTMMEDGAAVIEDDAIGLAVCRTQTASDHLAIEPHFLGRPSQDDAANIGAIKALGQHHAVADNLSLAAFEPCQYRVALVLGRLAVKMFGACASLYELVPDMDGMADAAGEHHGAPALAVFEPVGDDVTDELRLVDTFRELRLHVVAGLRLDA